MVVTGERSGDGSRPSLVDALFVVSVVQLRRGGISGSFGRSVVWSVTRLTRSRSLGRGEPRARPQRKKKQNAYFRKKKKKKTKVTRSLSRSHFVTFSFRRRCRRCCCRSSQLVYRSQPHAVALRSA